MLGTQVTTLVVLATSACAQSAGAAPPAALPAVALPARADVVLRWNDVALGAIRNDRTPPPVASRNLAMVHAAIYDAVNAAMGGYSAYLVRVQPMAGVSAEAAAAGAAHKALSELYPRQRFRFDQALSESLAPIPDGPAKSFGVDLGRFVGERVLAWRVRDNVSGRATYDPAPAPGVWQRTPPDYAEPLLPQWHGLTPFGVDARDRFTPRPPPQLTDPAYTAAFREVKEVGRYDSPTRTREQTEIALFWSDDAGTCTPPGHWNLIAQDVVRRRGSSLLDASRAFALLNVAMADAAILCWECKYRFAFWRPVTAIREADHDGNPDTHPDPSWRPLLNTPPFPSYTSGHSSFSGAAAAVLADVFGDATHFEIASDGLPGVRRSFDSFWAAAEEAGQSRVYGGIHYQFDNTEGLAMGRALGRFVCKGYMLPRPPEHIAAYPPAP